VNLGSGIVVMACMVDATTFNHEEEALVAVARGIAQRLHSSLGHLLQTRVHVVLIVAINLVWNICFREKPKHREVQRIPSLQVVKSSAIGNVVVSILLGECDHILVVGSTACIDIRGRVGEEVTPPTTKHQIDNAS
jgi:hypothetical protein